MLGPFSHPLFGLPGASGSWFGSGDYNDSVVQGGSVLQPVGGVLTVDGAATVAPDPETGASVVMCDQLVVDGGSLCASSNSKGLLVFANAISLLNGGVIHMDQLGSPGDFGAVNPFTLSPVSLQGKLNEAILEGYAMASNGAAGGPSLTASGAVGGRSGSNGSAAGAMQTGGGSGGGYSSGGTIITGNGGQGGPCCGGAGSGGAAASSAAATVSTADAGDFGGPASNAASNTSNVNVGGAAGEPVGTAVNGGNGAYPASGGGGGLVYLLAPTVSVASGCRVSANGASGGGTGGGYSIGGAGSGGGCVVVVSGVGGYSNAGTVQANAGSYGYGGHGHGGTGGNGSVNIFEEAI